MRTGLCAVARLSAGCWCLSLALLSFSAVVTAQFDDDDVDFDVTTASEKTMQDVNLDDDTNNNNNNNSSMRCWSCVAKFRTWADCQNLDEMEYCENPDVTSCMKSSIRIEGLLGRDTRYHRLAGCGLNKTALRDHYFEFFEITFGDSDAVTLEEFTTCEGPLCNVMDEAALKHGKWRTVHGNTITGAAVAGGGLAPTVALLMSVAVAISSFV
ncbi:uncharacterized protein LOC135700634 [Ochlerotatus camptorhynchus]|uniref:uncharacterized protein LOC135700634 n=1 Tax=Ochlerotatus camptorhynchus TaxID=644619 RepID=UPI0031D68305